MKTNTTQKKGSMSTKSGEKVSKQMQSLFEDQLKDIYWAEKELTRFMPELVKEVTSEELIDVLEEHMELTKKQVTRLEKIFSLLGSRSQAEKCDAMEGLVKEARKVIESSEKGIIRDAFIIGAVQKVEHYEMATYGTLKSMATLIGEYEISSLLGETLEEEKEADLNLTEVAENMVNIEASIESGELEDEEVDEIDDIIDEEDEEEEVMDEEDEDSDEPESRRRSRSNSPR
jgi:ferritin-like metal-binding protein YciE